MLRTRMIAGVALCVGVALAGCGGGGGGGDIASLTGGTSTTVKASSAKSSEKTQRDALVAYTRCLRKEGLDVADPTYGANDGPAGGGPSTASGISPDKNGARSGGTAVFSSGGGSISLPSPDDPAFKAADKKCKPILDAAHKDMPKPSAEEQAKAQDQALAFAKCMRKHGINMPDPVFNGDGGISIQMPGEVVTGDPNTGAGPSQKMQDASKACEKSNPMGKGGPGFGLSTSDKSS
jgi:hypothetical protein